MCKVDWALVVDHLAAGGGALAAVGAFVAAIVALKIANRSRQDSRRESDEAHMAQARLVRLQITGITADTRRVFAIEVENWGALSILDIALVSASFESSYRPPSGTPKAVLESPVGPPIPILVPKSREALAQERFAVDFRLDDTSVLGFDADVGYDPLTATTSRVSATIEFTDAYGNHWQQSTEGTPTRLTARSATTLHTTR